MGANHLTWDCHHLWASCPEDLLASQSWRVACSTMYVHILWWCLEIDPQLKFVQGPPEESQTFAALFYQGSRT